MRFPNVYNIHEGETGSPKAGRSHTMKKVETGKLFNEVIAEAIADGYHVAVGELTGSYGLFVDPIVLAKGRERIVLWGKEDRDYTLPYEFVALCVAKFELDKGERMESQYNWPKNWEQHIVKCFRLYGFGEYGNKWYVTSKGEALACCGVRQQRRELRRGTRRYLTWERVEMNDTLFDIAKKHVGFKRLERDEIEVERQTEGFGYRFTSKKNRNYTFSIRA